jgi:hypothetical protein
MFVVNLLSLSKIYFFKETATDISTVLQNLNISSHTPIFAIDRFGVESYAPNLNIYNNYNVIYDRVPSSTNYRQCFSTGDSYYVLTSIAPKSKFIVNGSILSADKITATFSVEENYINNSCDVRDLIMNPGMFRNYGDIKTICKTNNPPTNLAANNKTVYLYLMPKLNDIPSKCDLADLSKYIQADKLGEYFSYVK